MTPESQKTARLAALFLLGWMLFNYPILSLFNVDTLVFGIPFLYLFIFGVWIFMISASALVSRIQEQKTPHIR